MQLLSRYLGLLPSKLKFSHVTEDLVHLLKDINIDKAAGIDNYSVKNDGANILSKHM